MTDRAEVLAGVADADLSGKTALVTGGTDGIGREAALALGRLGATVLVHGRDRRKGRAVLDELESTSGEGVLSTADFTSLSAVEDLAETAREYAPLAVLANNAGALFDRGRLTGDGFERTIQVNHLAPFLLTARLADALAGDARVVTTASSVHRDGSIDFGSFRSVENYDGMDAYAQSKLANVLFTAELAARLDGERTANCLHPGVIPDTAAWGEVPSRVRVPARLLDATPIDPWDSSVDGAATLVYLAVAPELAAVSGRYFRDRNSTRPAGLGVDPRTGPRLWNESARMVGVDPAAVGERPTTG